MPQTCTYCQTSINDDDAFCQACGRPVASANGGDVLTENPEPAVAAVPTGGLPSWATPAHTGGLPSAPPTTSVPSAAAAPGGANDAYLGHRLTYSPQPEQTFDPLGSTRYLGQVALRAALYWAVWFIVYLVFLVLTLVTAGSSPNLSTLEGAGGFFGVVFLLFSLALAICFWFLKVPIQLSEWKLTVDGQAAAAPTVFSHIAWVLYGRQTPVESIKVQQFRLPRTGTRDYLELQSDMFYGYVACFPYGRDLYIGWTFWVRISPFRYLCMFVARVWQSLVNRGSDLYISLRYDTARAMREAIHSATREGVDVAVGHAEAQGQGIIGSAIQVVENTVTR
jgi:hypothetical protein